LSAPGPTQDVGEIESVILEIFRAILTNHSVGPEDDFFASGGDSLLAVDASERISQALSAPLDPLTLFMHPTASGCARAVVDNAGGS
jgi:hypothetical protein